MRQKYYVARQIRFPKKTYIKCGFVHQRLVHLEFGLFGGAREPRHKRGNFYLAKARAKQDANNIVMENEHSIIYKRGDIYHAMWLKGHNPLNNEGDYWYFYNIK